jgi:hypothetical protein
VIDEPVRRYLDHALPGGTEVPPGVRLSMRGRIKTGAWLPFTAIQEADGHSFTWRARAAGGLLHVVDRFAGGQGSMDIRLFGRVPLMHADGPDIVRSAAGRAALESMWAPASLLPERGVEWRAESDGLIVAAWDVPPERPALNVRIDERGAVRSIWALRWGNAGQKEHGYIPCGGEVLAERRFGPLVVPSRVRVGWWFGTPRYEPFFEAEVLELAPG